LLPLPFNCRIKEKGKSVDIAGVKKNFVIFGKYDPEFFSGLKQAFHWVNELVYVGDIFYADFIPLNSIIHVARLVNLFGERDSIDKDELFYEDMTRRDTDLMMKMTQEFISAVGGAIYAKRYFDIGYFLPFFVYRTKYDLHELFTKHSVYKGFTLPVKEIEGKFYPNRESRYLFEDIHNLKCCIRKSKIDTPVLKYCLEKMEEINEKSR